MKQWHWVVIISLLCALWFAWKRSKRKILIARIEERFGSMQGLKEKSTEELEQILKAA